MRRSENVPVKTIEERVHGVVAGCFLMDEDDLRTETRLRRDLGADSLDMAEIAMDLEEEFDLEVHEESVDWKTIGDISKDIENRLREQVL